MLTLKKYFLSICWTLIILGLTLMPGENIPHVPVVNIDKLVHFFIFGLLVFLFLFESKKQHPLTNKWIVLSIVSCITYGILIEVLQNFVPGRSFDVYDMIANSIGVLLGYLIFKLLLKK